jgi:hypothetical protein
MRVWTAMSRPTNRRAADVATADGSDTEKK